MCVTYSDTIRLAASNSVRFGDFAKGFSRPVVSKTHTGDERAAPHSTGVRDAIRCPRGQDPRAQRGREKTKGLSQAELPNRGNCHGEGHLTALLSRENAFTPDELLDMHRQVWGDSRIAAASECT